MLKRILFVVGAVLLAASLWAAAGSAGEERAARASAGSRLVAARDGAAREIVAIADEARAALAAYVPGAPAPPPLRWWGERSRADGDDAAPRVEFRRSGALEVVVPWQGHSVTGVVAAHVLRERLAAASGVGPPASRRAAGAYDHLAVVGPESDVELRVLAPRGEELREHPLWPHDHEAEPLKRIRAKIPCAVTADGTPPVYKGPRSERILGAWGAIDGLPEHHLLVERTESDALAGVSGWDVSAFGFRLGRARLWHVLLGGSLLSIVAGIFCAIVTRGGRVAVLMRVYRFARPYLAGIVLTIVMGALFSGAQISKTYIVKRLFDDVLVNPGPDAESQIWFLGWATFGVGVAMAVTGFFRDFLQNYFSTAMMADVRLELGRKLVSLPMSFFQSMRAGDLVARIERDSASLRVVLNQVFETVFTQPFILAGALLAAFMMNWRLALVLLGLPILVWPIYRISRKVKLRAEKRQVLLAEISHVLFQMVVGVKVVKAFGGEEREVRRLADRLRDFMKQVRKLQRLASLSDALVDMIQMAGGGFLVVVGGYGILEGGVSVGDLGAFMLVVQQCYAASKQITSVVNKFIEATPGTERVFEIFDAQDTLPDGREELPRGPLAKGIEFRDVHFRYRDADVLRGVSITIPAGKVVALVGPTGAGKTTVCDLVARFYDVTSGAVLVDGQDVRELTKRSLLRNVAIVTQDAFLFNTTVEENVLYGRPNATREEMEQAARDAFVLEEIERMEGGWSKVCGERGSSVSGGQRQRITIARALLKDAGILILDEATSNLDSHSEAQVQAALARLMRGRTVLVVAHRLSTIRNADHVVVLDNGTVVEEGPPAELLERPNGRFRRMNELQTLQGEAPPQPQEPPDEPPDLSDLKE